MEDWTEKYRPRNLSGIVGNDKAVAMLKKWCENWEKGKPNKKAVILSGKPGVGKTSAAVAISREYGWTLIELNTSDARNAKKIKQIATSGAMNETFDDQGRFISSRKGGRKLIMLDEADNLYERISGGSGKSDNNDYSDRGGKRAIVETVKNTNQPIILIVNDYYSLIKGSGEPLKKLCKQIKFYPPYNNQVFSLLKKICNREKINVNNKILQSIADRCGGDIRSAVNDLQSLCLDKKQVDVDSLNVLGYRDRQKIIFDALRDIFKTNNIKTIRETLKNLDEDPRSLLFWINENLPKEYMDIRDLSEGYDAISRADVFLGRTFRRQNYGLWSYASDMMNAGVAVSKSHSYPNERYRFPTWLRKKKSNKNTQVVKNAVIKKFSKSFHASRNKSQ
ncbi:MAG: replication factor C large subunit, partial [Candidatus Thermoplasmatota archaeon]